VDLFFFLKNKKKMSLSATERKLLERVQKAYEQARVLANKSVVEWTHEHTRHHLWFHARDENVSMSWQRLEQALSDHGLLPDLVSWKWNADQKTVDIQCSQYVSEEQENKTDDTPEPPVDSWMMQMTAIKKVSLPALADILSTKNRPSSIPAADMHVLSTVAGALWWMQGSTGSQDIQIELEDRDQPPYRLFCTGWHVVDLFRLRMMSLAVLFDLQDIHVSFGEHKITVFVLGSASLREQVLASRLFECSPCLLDTDPLPRLKRFKTATPIECTLSETLID
jgi:hypothetical protein